MTIACMHVRAGRLLRFGAGAPDAMSRGRNYGNLSVNQHRDVLVVSCLGCADLDPQKGREDLARAEDPGRWMAHP